MEKFTSWNIVPPLEIMFIEYLAIRTEKDRNIEYMLCSVYNSYSSINFLGNVHFTHFLYILIIYIIYVLAISRYKLST